MDGWTNFFIAQVGASAALAGLIFVAVSINLTKIVTMPQLSGRAFEMMTMLVTILIVSSLMLVPRQPIVVIGAEVLAIGIALWFLVTMFDIRILRKTDAPYRRLWKSFMVLSQCVALPYVVAGILLVARDIGGLYWLVAAFVLSFLRAMIDAWVLLVEINR